VACVKYRANKTKRTGKHPHQISNSNRGKAASSLDSPIWKKQKAIITAAIEPTKGKT